MKRDQRHLNALIRKNFDIWRRTPCLSALEILAPVTLMLVLVYLRLSIKAQTMPEYDFGEVSIQSNGQIDYTTLVHYPLLESPHLSTREEEDFMEDNYSFAGVIPRSRLFFIPRSCFWTGNYWTQKQWVGLAPRNAFTEDVAENIKRWRWLYEDSDGFYLQLKPMFFDTREEMMAYVEHPEYMTSEERRGLCFGIHMSQEGSAYDFEMMFEDQEYSEFQNMPSQNAPVVDRYAQYPDLDSYNFYVRQGYCHAQNWLANALLRDLTRESAMIVSMVRPMRSNEFVKDDFAYILQELLPLFMILMYLLPVYRLTARIVNEKHTRIRDLTRAMGLSEYAYWTSWFLFYAAVSTTIALACSLLLSFAVLTHSGFWSIFILVSVYGYSLFGYSLLMQSLFRGKRASPTFAAVITTLVFFVSSFCDLLVVASWVPEWVKMLASMATPGIAIKRATGIIAGFEQVQIGIQVHNWTEIVDNYRFLDSVVSMLFTGFIFTAIALQIETTTFTVSKKQKVQPTPATGEYFEQDQVEDNTLQLQGLVKQYDGTPVVDNLTLNMHKGQIFCLLGHNGAGKSTTIGMLTGLTTPQAGRILFKNKDITAQKPFDKIGICSQDNILFDLLTVREHFQLYQRLKKAVDDREIEGLISDLELGDYTTVLAKNLSGGNQRKLQVGLSLAGQTELVLLDEPTAGMDPMARRALWKVLERHKQGRVIILTTHHMDEADVLGDRIAIMSLGKLQCLGTSLFLKEKYGVGLQLVISEPSSDILAHCQKIDSRIELCEQKANETVLKLPRDFGNFFRKFDGLPNLFKSYSVRQTTLEQVFLRVAQGNDYKTASVSGLGDPVSKKPTFCKQMAAQFYKRIHVYRRSLKTFLMELVVPIVIVAAGLGISQIDILSSSPPRQVTLDHFGQNQTILVTNNITESSEHDTSPIEFIEAMNATPLLLNYEEQDPGYQGRDHFQQFYQDSFHAQSLPYQMGYGSYYLHEMNNQTKQFRVATFVNATSAEAAPIYLQSMYDAVLKTATGDPNVTMRLTNTPFPVSKVLLQQQNTVSGIFVVLVCCVAFALLPASIVTFIAQERASNLKHQQMIAGLRLIPYWLSNFCFDLSRGLVLCAAAYTLLTLVFEIPLKTEIWSVFLLYPACITMFTYATHKLFSNAAFAQNLTLFLHMAGALLLSVGIFMLRIFKQTENQGDLLLQASWFTGVPSLALSNSLLYALEYETLNNTRNYTEAELHTAARDNLVLPDRTNVTTDFYSIPNVGGELCSLSIWFMIWLLALILVESCNSCRKHSKRVIDALELEPDSAREALRDKSDDILQIQGLRKQYGATEAVKNCSFGVSHGECFCLLGVNGAGKSTTFKALTGEIIPDGGLIKVKSQTSFAAKSRHIGYCSQQDNLFDLMSVREHLNFYCLVKGVIDRKSEVEQLLDALNLRKEEHKLAHTLSGGNKRKLSVAIALVGGPELILLDEPSAGMDPVARRFMWRVVQAISKDRSAVVLTTHSMEEAEALSTKMGIMVQGGQFKCFGSAQHIKDTHGTSFEIEVNFKRQPQAKSWLAVEGSDLDSFTSCLRESGFTFCDMLALDIEKRGVLFGSIPSEPEPTQLLDWLNLQVQSFTFISQLLETYGQVTVIAHRESYYRFRVPRRQAQTIGFLLTLLQQRQVEFGISESQAEETTLEQIFHAFAKKSIDSVSLHLQAGEQYSGVSGDIKEVEFVDLVRHEQCDKGAVGYEHRS